MQYPVILADPPWQYHVWSEPKLIMKRDGSRSTGKRVAKAFYSTMPTRDIAALPIGDLAAKDCALCLWVTPPCLFEAQEVIKAWGFTYKTILFTWVKLTQAGKPRIGLGHYSRGNAELCLLATKGHPKRIANDVSQVIMSLQRGHSRKPDEQYGRIMRLFDGPYLEIFARQAWQGWDTWGNQTGKFPSQPFLFSETGTV